MPCDTRIRTTAPELVAVNRGRLAAAMRDDGWTVTITGEATATLDSRVITASRNGVSVRVSAQGASVTTGYGTETAESVLASVKRAYAARTVADVSARFGFQVKGAEQLLGGARRIVLGR